MRTPDRDSFTTTGDCVLGAAGELFRTENAQPPRDFNYPIHPNTELKFLITLSRHTLKMIAIIVQPRGATGR